LAATIVRSKGARILEVVSKQDPKLVKFTLPKAKQTAKPHVDQPSEYELMLEALLNPAKQING
jgi:hypothetical protein